MAGVSAPSHIFPSLAVIAELVGAATRSAYVVGERHRALVEPTGATSSAPDHHARRRRPLAGGPRGGDAGVPRRRDRHAADDRRDLQPATPCCTTSAASRGKSPRTSGASPPSSSRPTSVAWEGFEDDMAEFYEGLKASDSGARYFATLRGWLDEHTLDLDNDTFLGKPGALRRADPESAPAQRGARVATATSSPAPCIDESRNAPAGRRRPATTAARLHLASAPPTPTAPTSTRSFIDRARPRPPAS